MHMSNHQNPNGRRSMIGQQWSLASAVNWIDWNMLYAFLPKRTFLPYRCWLVHCLLQGYALKDMAVHALLDYLQERFKFLEQRKHSSAIYAAVLLLQSMVTFSCTLGFQGHHDGFEERLLECLHQKSVLQLESMRLMGRQ